MTRWLGSRSSVLSFALANWPGHVGRRPRPAAHGGVRHPDDRRALADERHRGHCRPHRPGACSEDARAAVGRASRPLRADVAGDPRGTRGRLPARGASARLSTGALVRRSRAVPALRGWGAPRARATATACWTGLTAADTADDLVKAVVDGIAAAADAVHAIERESVEPVATLRMDGGVTRSRAFVQHAADLLQRPVAVSENRDVTCLGVPQLGLAALTGRLSGTGRHGRIDRRAADIRRPRREEFAERRRTRDFALGGGLTWRQVR
jgi:carbohydrate kinase of FGGY family protein